MLWLMSWVDVGQGDWRFATWPAMVMVSVSVPGSSPLFPQGGSQWLWDVQRKKAASVFRSEKNRPRLQDSISFGGIFWWKDDLSRWLTGMVECVTILSDHIRYKKNMYKHISHHFSINDSITVFVRLPEWFVIFCFFWPCQTTWICINAFFMDCTKA